MFATLWPVTISLKQISDFHGDVVLAVVSMKNKPVKQSWEKYSVVVSSLVVIGLLHTVMQRRFSVQAYWYI